ncbi:chitobiase/beta-hexosaminidase C-terminal domain-containing protein [Butyrivibrio sp. NC3005]|uniref:chitobiase/beta-hexosaminidase C-terminal domain-containing protein n=1 Tax=Butyrivibrio sp. NC3005 TaxID=1280685 RepID=UPI0004208818|nr:chitobiase/beta-hexosaminidase C-terminal domain-containing protein [Butyrivibrio sp. NC3005]
MQCPKCGDEIPKGSLYCPKCGEEIKIVPEFDPEIENQIDESLLGLAESIEDARKHSLAEVSNGKALDVEENGDDFTEDDFDSNEEGRIFNSTKITVTCMVALLFVICICGFLCIKKLFVQEESEEKKVVVSDSSSQAITAPKGLKDKIKELEALEDYEEIQRILKKTTDTGILDEYSGKYLPNMPEYSLAQGIYDKSQLIHITSGKGKIYYTINEDDPTIEDKVYDDTEPIELDDDGVYEIRAVYENELGLFSDVATIKYEIAQNLPSLKILEASGNYTTDTQIVAATDNGCSIYYTVDGSKPSTSSNRYTGPIHMPYGESKFKFIAYNAQNSRYSHVVECNYSLHYSVEVSHEQAVSALLEKLIEKGYLLDGYGRATGLDGYYLYIVAKSVTINSGDYYVLVENHVYSNGTQTMTGLLYGVNVHTREVYRLGTDIAGNYFLKQLN